MARAAKSAPNDVDDVDASGAIIPPGQHFQQPIAPRNPAPRNDDFDDEEDDHGIDAVDRVRALLADSGDGVYIKAYRRDPSTGKLDWCDDYQPDQFEIGGLGMVRKTHGPGEYEMRVINRKGIGAKVRLRIAAPIVADNPVALRGESEISQLARMVADSNQRIIEALSARPDPVQNMQQAIAMIVSMREVLAPPVAAAPAAPAVSMLDMVTQFAGAMRQMQAVSKELNPPEAAATDSESPLALFGEVVGLVRETMGRSSPAPALPAPSFPPIMIPGSLGQASEVVPVQPAPIAPAAAPTAAPTEESVEMMVLQGTLDALLELAKKGEPIEKGGEFIADNMPEQLLRFLVLPNWFAILCKFAPRAREYEEWLGKAKAHADKLFEEAEREADAG